MEDEARWGKCLHCSHPLSEEDNWSKHTDVSTCLRKLREERDEERQQRQALEERLKSW